MQKPTKFGSYIIIPLKYDHESFQEAKLKEKLQVVPVTTMDLNENVKEIFNRSAHAVGSCYGVSRSILCEAFLNAHFRFRLQTPTFMFSIRSWHSYACRSPMMPWR